MYSFSSFSFAPLTPCNSDSNLSIRLISVLFSSSSFLLFSSLFPRSVTILFLSKIKLVFSLSRTICAFSVFEGQFLAFSYNLSVVVNHFLAYKSVETKYS